MREDERLIGGEGAGGGFEHPPPRTFGDQQIGMHKKASRVTKGFVTIYLQCHPRDGSCALNWLSQLKWTKFCAPPEISIA